MRAWPVEPWGAPATFPPPRAPGFQAGWRLGLLPVVAFDLLACDGLDLRQDRFLSRRARLERLAAAWQPPLLMTMSTTDVARAAHWCDDVTPRRRDPERP